MLWMSNGVARNGRSRDIHLQGRQKIAGSDALLPACVKQDVNNSLCGKLNGLYFTQRRSLREWNPCPLISRYGTVFLERAHKSH